MNKDEFDKATIGFNFKKIIKRIIRKDYLDQKDFCKKNDLKESTLNSLYNAKSISPVMIDVCINMGIDLNDLAYIRNKQNILTKEDFISDEEKIIIHSFKIAKNTDSIYKIIQELDNKKTMIFDSLINNKIKHFRLDKNCNIVEDTKTILKSNNLEKSFLRIGFCEDVEDVFTNCTPLKCFSCDKFITTQDFKEVIQFVKDTEVNLKIFFINEKYKNCSCEINNYLKAFK